MRGLAKKLIYTNDDYLFYQYDPAKQGEGQKLDGVQVFSSWPDRFRSC